MAARRGPDHAPGAGVLRLRLASLLLVLLLGIASAASRNIRFADLPPQARQWLSERGISARGFAGLVQAKELRTKQRLLRGENDHLVYFLLQSSRFTRHPAIEPALSAREFVEGLNPERRLQYLSGHDSEPALAEQIPNPVRRRIDDLAAALARPASDERLSHYRKFLEAERDPRARLRAEYVRSMRFLYLKEFLPAAAGPVEEQSRLAALYQQRGHSTDTRMEANYAVWTALSVLRALSPSIRLDPVLIVGPGLDFAPRTELVEQLPPQSYQPFALADALLSLDLADARRWRIDCVDINPRVVDHLRDFPKRSQPRLTLVTGYQDPAYVEYFEKLGRHIARQAPSHLPPGAYRGKTLWIRPEVARRVTAHELDIVTRRQDPSPRYGLVVATNVFAYFDSFELLLALSNIEAMLRPGGYLVHNELRAELESFSRGLGLSPIQARSLRLTAESQPTLGDAFLIHRKTP